MSDLFQLEVKDLHFSYGEARVLNGLSLAVKSGEIVAVVGANGAGKTTLLRTISGLLRPRSGTIHFEGRDITREPTYRIAQSRLAQVPEGRLILKRMTARDNLLLGADIRNRANDAESVEAMLDIFPDLRPRLDEMAGILSGGQQQMLAVARALIGRPRLLMLDEPSLGLAPLIVNEIFGIIEKLRQRGNTILLVEQNARRALSVADRAYVVELGKITIEGRARDVMADGRIIDAYLGT